MQAWAAVTRNECIFLPRFDRYTRPFYGYSRSRLFSLCDATCVFLLLDWFTWNIVLIVCKFWKWIILNMLDEKYCLQSYRVIIQASDWIIYCISLKNFWIVFVFLCHYFSCNKLMRVFENCKKHFTSFFSNFFRVFCY